MKRLFLAIILFFISVFAIFADEYVVYKGNALRYNDVLKTLDETQFIIKYDDQENTYYLFTSDWINKIWIYISADDLDDK